MKAVLIAPDAARDAEINERLQAVGIESGTRFPQALGRGRRGEPRLDGAVRPG